MKHPFDRNLSQLQSFFQRFSFIKFPFKNSLYSLKHFPSFPHFLIHLDIYDQNLNFPKTFTTVEERGKEQKNVRNPSCRAWIVYCYNNRGKITCDWYTKKKLFTLWLLSKKFLRSKRCSDAFAREFLGRQKVQKKWLVEFATFLHVWMRSSSLITCQNLQKTREKLFSALASLRCHV